MTGNLTELFCLSNFFFLFFTSFQNLLSYSSEFETLTACGTKILVKKDQCIFIYKGVTNDTKYYKCSISNCPVRGKISNFLFTYKNEGFKHSHTFNHNDNVACQKLMNDLKKMTKTDRRPVRLIHKDFINEIPARFLGTFAWSKIRHTLLRVRRASMPQCRNLEEFISLLEDEKSFTFENFGQINGEDFYCGAVDSNMIFANKTLIKELNSDCDIFADGTFGILPFKCSQLFIICAELQFKPRPIVYCVMKSKKEKDYIKVLNFVKNGLLSCDGQIRQLKSVMLDYEVGLRNAFKKVWPSVEVNGCLFHMNQCLRRKALSMEKLRKKIKRGTEHTEILNLFQKLPLLPIDQIDAGLNLLKKKINTDKNLAHDFEEFVLYFQKTWLNHYVKGDWCVSNKPRRTNNHVEGMNHQLKLTIPSNPNPWVFLDGLRYLAINTISEYFNDQDKGTQFSDRSAVTRLLNENLKLLHESKINELKFLELMCDY